MLACAGIKSETHLAQVCAQRLLAQHVQALVNGGNGLASMDICAGCNPNSIQPSMVEHVIVVLVDCDAKLLVLLVFLCPFDLVWQLTACGDDIGARSAVEKGVDVTLAL